MIALIKIYIQPKPLLKITNYLFADASPPTHEKRLVCFKLLDEVEQVEFGQLN